MLVDEASASAAEVRRIDERFATRRGCFVGIDD